MCHGLDSAPAPRMSARHKVMLQLAHELPVAELVDQSSSSARTETPVAVFASLILATSPHSSPHTRGNAGCSQLCVRSTELELRRSHPVQKVQHAFLHRSVQIRHIVCLSVKCSRIPIRDRSSARRVSLSLAVTIVCMSLSHNARGARLCKTPLLRGSGLRPIQVQPKCPVLPAARSVSPGNDVDPVPDRAARRVRGREG